MVSLTGEKLAAHDVALPEGRAALVSQAAGAAGAFANVGATGALPAAGHDCGGGISFASQKVCSARAATKERLRSSASAIRSTRATKSGGKVKVVGTTFLIHPNIGCDARLFNNKTDLHAMNVRE